MNQVFLLLDTELKCKFSRKKIRWISLTVLVILLISTVSYVKNSENKKQIKKESVWLQLGVADYEASEYTSILLDYFRNNKELMKKMNLTEGERTQLIKAVETGALDGMLVIPEQFTKKLLFMEHSPIEAWVSMENPTKAVLLSQAMKGYEKYISSVEINCSVLYQLMNTDYFSREEQDKANVNISLKLISTAMGTSSFFKAREIKSQYEAPTSIQYSISITFLLFLFFCIPFGIRLLDAKKTGILGRNYLAGISFSNQFFATLLPYAMVAWLPGGVACLLYPTQDDTKGFVLLLTAFLTIGMILVIGLLGILCERRQSYLLMMSLILLLLILIGGNLIPIRYLPEELAGASTFLPNSIFFRATLGMYSRTELIQLSAITLFAIIGLFFGSVGALYQRRGGASLHE